MRILIDTNILIDFLAKREPYFQEAEKIMTLCSDEKLEGYVAAHSITDAFYILRRAYSSEERREMLLELCNILTVVGIDKRKLTNALSNFKFEDMEDCLQTECAIECNAAYIVTRNVKDFEESKILPITPKDFLFL